MKNNQYLITGIVAVVVAGCAFFGGMQYQMRQSARQFSGGRGNGNFVGGMMGRTGANARVGGANGIRPVAGEIIEQDDKSLTVKLPDGSSKIIILSDKTVIAKTTTATKIDLAKGIQVTIFGTTNTDGSVTAQNVMLGQGMFRGGMMGQPATGSATQK